MTVRFHITLGATTSAGGKVITATSHRSIDGVAVACSGDSVYCPACASDGVIEPHGARLSERFNGREVALSDDLCRCQCNPAPHLIANQDFSKQIVDVEWAAARAGAALAAAARLNTPGSSASLGQEGVPLVLLDRCPVSRTGVVRTGSNSRPVSSKGRPISTARRKP